MDSEQQIRPVARKSRLVTRSVDSELLVYDLEKKKAHCLNDTAARVWRSCDGHSTPAAIAQSLKAGSSSEVDEQIVWYALARLQKLDLLEERVVPAAMMSTMGRRDAVRMLGLASVMAVPIITSIIAPTPAQAASGCPSPDCGPP